MMNQQSETRLMLTLIGIGYILNFLFGLTGSFFHATSYPQMICWQMGDSLAIMASVLMTRYVGSRGQNIAAAGFTLLAIAYGVSFGSSSINAINAEKMATIVLPLLPATFLICFCGLFPAWLRFGSLLIVIPFFFMYKNVAEGTYHHENLSNTLAYTGLQILGILWFVFSLKDFIKQKALNEYQISGLRNSRSRNPHHRNIHLCKNHVANVGDAPQLKTEMTPENIVMGN